MKLHQTTCRQRYQNSTHKMAMNPNRGRFSEKESSKPFTFDFLQRLIRYNQSAGMERSMIRHIGRGE